MNKTVYELNFNSLQCAFTIGFLFRNLYEFTQLLDFFKKFNNDKCRCFHIHFDTNIEKENEINENDAKYIDNDKNDF